MALRRIKIWALWMLAVLALAGMRAEAGGPVVVELYTSQGCSSCPPADKLLAELAERDDVIALALHVDYWDYIGWKDPFADPGHAERQRLYAAVAGRRTIYTPQMIVGGQDSIVGARAMELADALRAHERRESPVSITLRREGDTLFVKGSGAADVPVVVHMLRYTPEREQKILRGENAGRQIRYANVVEGWETLETLPTGTVPDLSVPISGELPVVVLIQEAPQGAMLAAARLR